MPQGLATAAVHEAARPHPGSSNQSQQKNISSRTATAAADAPKTVVPEQSSTDSHLPTDWSSIAAGLRTEVMKSLGIDLSAHHATPIANRRDLIDSTIKYTIQNEQRDPVAVLKLSSEIDPQSVADSTQVAEEIASSLRPETARHILRPLTEHQYGGRSVAIYPYLEQLKMFRPAWILQRRAIAPNIMYWIKEVSRQTVSDATDVQVDSQYITPLKSIVDDEGEFGPQFAAMAKLALTRIDSGKMAVKTVAMHGDPWKNNILVDARNVSGFDDGKASSRFMFIDWDTGRPEGFPFFDLIRLSNTLRTRESQMRLLIRDYCEIVEATPEDIGSYITAALGHTLLNLNNCPRHVVALSSQIFLEDLNRLDLV